MHPSNGASASAECSAIIIVKQRDPIQLHFRTIRARSAPLEPVHHLLRSALDPQSFQSVYGHCSHCVEAVVGIPWRYPSHESRTLEGPSRPRCLPRQPYAVFPDHLSRLPKRPVSALLRQVRKFRPRRGTLAGCLSARITGSLRIVVLIPKLIP
jgi:hypothetical protein